MPHTRPPLAGLRVLECSLLGPGAIGTHLADLGAEVIKVESPAGDYIREMTWPIIEGVSLLHLHIHRGKKSIALDLKTPAGVELFRELAKESDVVIEAMRPGSLAARGLGFAELAGVNPKLVFCNVSGYGATGPYRDLPAHGIAFDTWGGAVKPAYDE
jgi:crotonobetainyl-CoA:carnitine CoA-transferase CaiB-like acyl-CoA transferase